MNETERLTRGELTFGDAAVDGLLAGVAAGVVMAAVLLLAALVRGEALGGLLGRFDPSPARSAVTGVLVHLAVSGVYGVLYGLGRRLAGGNRRPAGRGPLGWLSGGLYGALIWLVAFFVLLPGTASPLRDIPWLVFLAAHVVYGLALGRVYQRR